MTAEIVSFPHKIERKLERMVKYAKGQINWEKLHRIVEKHKATDEIEDRIADYFLEYHVVIIANQNHANLSDVDHFLAWLHREGLQVTRLSPDGAA